MQVSTMLAMNISAVIPIELASMMYEITLALFIFLDLRISLLYNIMY